MQALIFRCPWCGTGIRPGGFACSDPKCQDKEIAHRTEIARQTQEKCQQLGIPFPREHYPGAP